VALAGGLIIRRQRRSYRGDRGLDGIGAAVRDRFGTQCGWQPLRRAVLPVELTEYFLFDRLKAFDGGRQAPPWHFLAQKVDAQIVDDSQHKAAETALAVIGPDAAIAVLNQIRDEIVVHVFVAPAVDGVGKPPCDNAVDIAL